MSAAHGSIANDATGGANGVAMAPPRLAQVDALRGFALLGILVVNIGVFASPFYANGIADPAFSSRADLAVRWLVAWLFETKFYLLFSFLFGYSFTLQMAAAWQGWRRWAWRTPCCSTRATSC